MPELIEMTEKGLRWKLDRFLRDPITPDPGWYLMLFANQPDLGLTTVLADLAECTFTGYGRRLVQRSQWSVPVVDGDGLLTVQGPAPYSWTLGGSGETVYGYAVVDPVAGEIRWCQLFDTPIPVASGGTLQVELRYRESCWCVCAV